MDEVDSTSTRLLSLAAAGAPPGTCLAAEFQSAGRGRRGRSWVNSLGGSLTFSLLWRFERGAGHLGGLSLAVGLAVARALSACGVERAQVKWPNDVVVDLRKVAGLLVETSGEMAGPSVAVIGVGVNYRLADAVVDRIDQPVIDVVRGSAVTVARGELLARLLAELEVVLTLFEREGFSPLKAEWVALHAYQGRRVRVLPAGEAPYDATVTDVAADGALIVELDSGRSLALSSAELSLRGQTPISPR
jgi:BirA family biotin operon repressor/biotin-[acetyl-CoA-carboxylase] ligase